MWRSRRWRELLNLVDHLPRDSYYAEALLNDEEFAVQVAQLELDESARERISEWSPLREALARIEDAVRVLSANVIAAAGAKPPQVDPAVRPITAVDRLRARTRREQHDALVARVLRQP